MQLGHLVAVIAISVMQYGQLLVLGSGGGEAFFAAARADSALMGLTIRKNTTSAIIKKLTTVFKNVPKRNTLLFTVADKPLKLNPPTIPIRGVIRSFTSDWTTPLKAVPMITPTARSTTLPLRTKSLN